MVKKATEILGIESEFYAQSGKTISCSHTEISEWTDLKPLLNHDVVIRSLASSSELSSLKNICNSMAIHIYDRKPNPNGRFELLNYLTEQNFSYNFHRYGNLLGEGDKEKTENVNLR
jgi:RHH-type proline utilization regulon transcriptional repressor/proline dehydrogenase/delta 1-pyrroline-5-carboxylate dehydrogenase